jgi:butyrate kinase
MYKILVINPGSTSTKVSVFENENEKISISVDHKNEDLANFNSIFDQLSYRKDLIIEFLNKNSYKLEDFDIFIGRGGPISPITSGVYIVDEDLVYELKNNYSTEHPSLLGGLIVYEFSKITDKKAYIADPVSVDEFEDIARISGFKEIERKSLTHALNIKAIARKSCLTLNKEYENINMIIAHLGGGITISAHKNGKMVDVNNANANGPFSPERCGTLPIDQLIELCYSNKYTKKELMTKMLKKGGLFSYLNKTTKDAMIDLKNGDKYTKLIIDAMIYQIAKEIGAMATVLYGKIDIISITGGVSYNDYIIDNLKERISFICDNILVFPGEGEMESLASSALLVLENKTKVKTIKEGYIK